MDTDYFIKKDKIYVSQISSERFMRPTEVAGRLERGEFILRESYSKLQPKISMVSGSSPSDAVQPHTNIECGLMDSVKKLLMASVKKLLMAAKPTLYNIIYILSAKDADTPQWDTKPATPATPAAIGYLEDFFKYLSSLFQEKEKSINELFFYLEGEPAPQIYIFYCSASDLLNSTGYIAFVKSLVNDHNNIIVPMDKVQNSQIWNYYKSHFYGNIIEKQTPHSFLNGFIFFRLPLSELTTDKLIASKFMQAYEYWEEYIFLQKAKIGMEYLLCKNVFSKVIFFTKYTFADINEVTECLHKYWLRQIEYYNNLILIDRPDYYEHLPNMFDIDTVYKELLENTLFVQCQILEAYWTINLVQEYINSSATPLNELSSEERKNFYNMVYEKFQEQILEVHKKAYSVRRDFIISRAIPCSQEYHLYWHKVLLSWNEHIKFGFSKIDNTNFHKPMWKKDQ